MNNNFKMKEILIADIDTGNRSYMISTKRPLSILEKSIRSAGLINPPTLCTGGENFFIISGFHRIQACINIGFEKIWVKLIDSTGNNSEWLKTAIAISENSFARSLNFVELARAFKLLSDFYPDKDVMLKKAPELNLSNSLEFIEKIVRINEMPNFLQEALIKETVSLPVALEMERFEPEEKEIFIRLFDKIRFGLTRQRSLMFISKEISIIENISISDLFYNDIEISDIISDDNNDNKKKGKLLSEALTRRRYPVLSAAKKRFAEGVKELNLGGNINFTPPTDFEGSIYSISISFKNIEELKARKEKLDSIISSRILKKIME